MTTRTDYLSGADLVDYRIMAVLQEWIEKEAVNLQSFINSPTEHVNYNPYMIFDFDKLNARLTMIQKCASDLNVIVQYKQGNPDYSQSMNESALDEIGSIIFQRLLDWLQKRYVDMANLIQQNGDPNNVSPLHDYVGMFTFDHEKFMTEFTMYENAINGVTTIVNYKVEQGV